MQLPETQRQLVAGGGAALAFLGLFLGLNLVWWLALTGGLLTFAALMLMVARLPPPERRYAAEGVSEAELREARAALQEGARRFRALSNAASQADQALFSELADLMASIDGHHARDPQDARHTRRFVRHDLGRMLEASENYVTLSRQSGAREDPRLSALREMVRGFLPVAQSVDRACLENDFMALEVQLEVLSDQFASHR